jgi:hypothetical protein
MKKSRKKLVLHRETLRSLSAPTLRAVHGASIAWGCTEAYCTATFGCPMESDGCPNTHDKSACGQCEI